MPEFLLVPRTVLEHWEEEMVLRGADASSLQLGKRHRVSCHHPRQDPPGAYQMKKYFRRHHHLMEGWEDGLREGDRMKQEGVVAAPLVDTGRQQVYSC